MQSSTISSKHQIVIPKQLRRKLHLQPGQKVYITSGEVDGEIIIKTKSQVEKLYGAVKGGWGEDSNAYIHELRQKANSDRA